MADPMAQGVLTDDNSVWPEDRPVSALPSPSTPAPAPSDPYGGYWIPRILSNLYQAARSGFTLPHDVATGQASMSDPQTQARVGDMTGLVMGGGLAGPAESDALNTGFRLYHGTNSFFEKPSTQFMGKGQGAQTYGWGLYGPGRACRARHAQSAFRRRRQNWGSSLSPPGVHPGRAGAFVVDQRPCPAVREPLCLCPGIDAQPSNPGGDGPPKDAEDAIKVLDNWQTQGATPTSAGHMQEWEVNADPDHFLDYDYTVGDEQSSHVLDALQTRRLVALP